MSKITAFLRKDILDATSYRFSFFVQLTGVFFSICLFFFLSRLIPGNRIPQLAPYGGDYFSFVLIGIAFSGYLGFSFGAFPGVLREAQLAGTLESLLVTRTTPLAILLYASMFKLLHATLHTLCYIAAGSILGMNLACVNWPGVLVILLLTITSLMPFGIVSAGIILVYKKGDPFRWAIASLTGLLSGILYPVGILPPWLQRIAKLIPFTHSLEGLRLAILGSAGWDTLYPTIVWLFLFSLVLNPLALLVFRYSLDTVRRRGTLSHY